MSKLIGKKYSQQYVPGKVCDSHFVDGYVIYDMVMEYRIKPEFQSITIDESGTIVNHYDTLTEMTIETKED